MFEPSNMSSRKTRAVVLLGFVLMVAGCGGTPEQRAQSYADRGAKFLSEKNYEKAGLEFKNALQVKKDLFSAWKGLSQVEEHNKNWPGLAPILRTMVDLNPKDLD